MKSCISATSMAMAVLAFSALAKPVGAQHQVPFQGTFMGSFTRVSASPPFIDVLLTGTGNATQLGRFTAVFPHRVDVSTVPSTFSGTFTFTAANGDTLLADSVGHAMLVAPGIVRGVQQARIKGGTGRFAGARGEFVMERLVNQVTLTTMGSFKGTISSVGAGKR